MSSSKIVPKKGTAAVVPKVTVKSPVKTPVKAPTVVKTLTKKVATAPPPKGKAPVVQKRKAADVVTDDEVAPAAPKVKVKAKAAPRAKKTKEEVNQLLTDKLSSVMPEISSLPEEHQHLAAEMFGAINSKTILSRILHEDAKDKKGDRLTIFSLLKLFNIFGEMIFRMKYGEELRAKKTKTTAADKDAMNEEDSKAALADTEVGEQPVVQEGEPDENGNPVWFIEVEGVQIVTDEQGNPLEEEEEADSTTDAVDEEPDYNTIHEGVDEEGNQCFYLQDAEGNQTITDAEGNVIEDEVAPTPPPPSKKTKALNGKPAAAK